MQNNAILINTLRFVLLIFLQVLLLNHINFLGYINPYIYILFILLYPLSGNKGLLIFLSFLLGFSIDIFGDSGGVHAAASVFIAYIRPWILKFSFGISYEHNNIKLYKTSLAQQFTYIVAMVFLHHITLFSLEIFNPSHILLIMKSTLFSGIFSIILLMSILILFSRKN